MCQNTFLLFAINFTATVGRDVLDAPQKNRNFDNNLTAIITQDTETSSVLF